MMKRHVNILIIVYKIIYTHFNKKFELFKAEKNQFWPNHFFEIRK
jgi:hypothetical protein